MVLQFENLNDFFDGNTTQNTVLKTYALYGQTLFMSLPVKQFISTFHAQKTSMMSLPNTNLFFKNLLLLFLFSLFCIHKASSQTHPTPAMPAIAGRWDITVDHDGKQLPSWLGVWVSGNNTLVGEFVSSGGSARPVSHVLTNSDSFHFSIPPQWEKDSGDLTIKGIVSGDIATGLLIEANGKQYGWSALRAPLLKRTATPVWGKPLTLFNGKDLTGWHAMGDNQWVVENGVLKSPHSGANLVTDDRYNDFKLHIEFRYPAGSNSGVYLRGRYEVQIEDGDTVHPAFDRLGAVYGFIAPSEAAGKGAGDWQSYDITLIGRMVTVALNGVTIICNREIPGITGGAIDSREGEPGPLQIQGDHGPIEYRNIVLTPGK